MAHKLFVEDQSPVPSSKRGWRFPEVSGRFGLALYIGTKEVFMGIVISPVTLEQIIKKRIIPVNKAKAKVFRFDPFS